MLSHMVPIYMSAAATVGILGAFAAHNQKKGWKKSRTTLVEALNDLYADFGLSSGDELPGVPPALTAQRAITHEEAMNFSLQLLKLRRALDNPERVKATEAQQEQAEFVLSR